MKIFLLISFMLFGLIMVPSLVAESPKIGKITWDEDIFHKGSDFFAKKIQVIDSDMNQNQNKIEKILVQIRESDHKKRIQV